MPVIALSEETGLLIQNHSIKVIGNQEAVVYDEKGIRVVGIGDVIK
jgi:hypothetical protein